MAWSIDIAQQDDRPILPEQPSTAALAARPVSSGQATSEQSVSDAVGGIATGGTQDGISVVYDPIDRELDFTNTDKGSVAVAAHVAAVDPHADRAYADALMATHNSTSDVHQIADVDGLQEELDLACFESTGTVTGFGLSIFSSTQITIAAGIAIFVDFTDPSAPLQSDVHYAGANITITAIGSQIVTYLGINSSGAIVQQATPFTPLQRRSIATLGTAVHVNLTSINAVVPRIASLHATGNQLHDLLEALGALNTTGNVYGPNGANLNLNRSGGNVFKFGVNTSYDDPHNLAISGMTAGNFFYHTSTGVINGPVSTINVTQYESSPGTLSTVSNNKFTIQRIYLFTSGVTRIQYGRTEYATMLDAEAALLTETFTVEPVTAAEGVFRAYMIVKKSASDASNVAQVKFFTVNKFGATASGGTALTSANIIAALGYTPAAPSDITTAIATHSAASDPHGDRAFATAAIATHTAAADPHGDRAYSVARANHTGTQLAATISDFSTAADARIAAASVNALADVTITAAASNDVMRYNGSAWVNVPFSTAAAAYLPLAGGSMTGGLLLPYANAQVELGLSGTANTPYIDFHSSANSHDYDVRLICSGGTASVGNGILTCTGNWNVTGGGTYGSTLRSNTNVTAGASSGVGVVSMLGGGASNTGYIEFTSPAGNRQGYIGYSTTNASTDTGTIPYVALKHEFSGIASIGGASAGTHHLEVKQASNNCQVLIKSGNSVGYSYLDLTNNASRSMQLLYAGGSYPTAVLNNMPTGEGGVLTTGGAYPLGLGTANTARITIDGGGRVGIGGVPSATSAGDLYVMRSSTTGAIFFGSSAAKYLYNDATNFILSASVVVSSFDGNVAGVGLAGDFVTRRDANSGVVYFGDNGSRYFYITSTTAYLGSAATTFIPGADSSCSLGTAGNRWSIVYAQGGVNTSDAREKQDFAALTEAERLVAIDLKGMVKTYRWKDAVAKKGAEARIHCGWVAQEVRDAFIARGLDPTRYAMFCKDTWWELEGPKKQGPGESETVPEGTPGAVKVTRYGLRYTDLMAFIISTL